MAELTNIFKLFKISRLPEKFKEKFSLEHSRASIPYLRFTAFLMLIFLVPYYWLDYVSSPNHYAIIWIIRTLGLTIPAVLVLLFSKKQFYVQNYQTFTTLFVLTGSLSIEAMLLFCDKQEVCFYTYFLGILVLNSVSIPTRLRLKNAFIVYTISFLGFILILLLKQQMYQQPALLFNRLLLGISLIASLFFGHFFIEDSNIRKFINQLKLQEANEELSIQNSIIINQKSELEAQNEILNQQKQLLESYNKKISDSIRYAQKIQFALLPDTQEIKQVFSDSFLFFKPKETVSGDFYFWKKQQNRFILALADSTGHGVPGAFMSILLLGFLREIINKTDSPSQILAHLRNYTINALKQGKSRTINDGCDISMITLDLNEKIFKFSAANMDGLYISKEIHDLPIIGSKGELNIYKLQATRQPISFYYKMEDFNEITIKYSPQDKIILFSDGIVDQFDSAFRKLTRKRFYDFVIQHANNNAQTMGQKILQSFDQWRHKDYQTDDISMLILEF